METGSLAPGTVIDRRYQIVRVVGSGGFSVVYEARQIATTQRVALKLLHAGRDPGFGRQQLRDRFERELRLIARLSHPNIVGLLDGGHMDDDQLYMALEFIDGESLKDAILEGDLNVAETRHLMTQVLDALTCAHDMGIIHRDLKPQNIMITGTGARRHAKVVDFGISTIVAGGRAREDNYQSLTQVGQVCGTPGYMSPEQLRDEEPTPLTDIYAWGLVLLECLTRTEAVRGRSPAEIIFQQLNPKPIPIPPWLREHPVGMIIKRAIAKNVDERFSSAREALAAFEACDMSDIIHAQANTQQLTVHTSRTSPDATTMPSMHRLQSAIICSQCSHDNPGDHRFCESCGSALSRFCPNCGTVAREGIRFCGTCGNAIDEPAPPSNPRPSVNPKPPVSRSASAEPRASTYPRSSERTQAMISEPRSSAPAPDSVPRSRSSGRASTPPPAPARPSSPPEGRPTLRSFHDETKLSGRVSSSPPEPRATTRHTPTRIERSSLVPSEKPSVRTKAPPAKSREAETEQRAKGFEVRADQKLSILRLRVWGFWDIEDGQAYWAKFKHEADLLIGKPWHVLADISQFPAQRPDVNAYVEKTMLYARSNGMVRASNLVSSALSRMQIARLSAESGLPAYTFFQSEEAAVEWLLKGN